MYVCSYKRTSGKEEREKKRLKQQKKKLLINIKKKRTRTPKNDRVLYVYVCEYVSVVSD